MFRFGLAHGYDWGEFCVDYCDAAGLFYQLHLMMTFVPLHWYTEHNTMLAAYST